MFAKNKTGLLLLVPNCKTLLLACKNPDVEALLMDKVFFKVTASLKVAAPAADISKVSALISLPPSLPIIVKSASEVEAVILAFPPAKTKSGVESKLNVILFVPPSFMLIVEPSASRIISPATSIVRSPLDKSISVPSIVILSIDTPALAVTAPPTAKVEAISTAPSISTTSRLVVPSTSISPDMSSAVPIRVCEKVTCPLEAIVIASASEAEPIVFPSPIIISSLKVAVCAKVTPPPSAMVMASSPSVNSIKGVCIEELLSMMPLVCKFKEAKASTIAPPEPAPSE